MREKEKNKIITATNKHLDNIKTLSEREPSEKELEEMYSYLDSCYICGKGFTFLNRLFFRITHSFCGNAHKKCIYE